MRNLLTGTAIAWYYVDVREAVCTLNPRKLFMKKIIAPHNRKSLTDAEFCQLFNLSPVTSWRYRKRGILPHLNFGHSILYLPEHIDAFIAAHSRNTTPLAT